VPQGFENPLVRAEKPLVGAEKPLVKIRIVCHKVSETFQKVSKIFIEKLELAPHEKRNLPPRSILDIDVTPLDQHSTKNTKIA
jgi:hypothetical protein